MVRITTSCFNPNYAGTYDKTYVLGTPTSTLVQVPDVPFTMEVSYYEECSWFCSALQPFRGRVLYSYTEAFNGVGSNVVLRMRYNSSVSCQ